VDSAPKFLSMTAFGLLPKDLPQPYYVGVIIRVHKAKVSKLGTRDIINCDSSIQAAWVLFHPSEGMRPISYSGFSYSYWSEDSSNLEAIRSFAVKFFRSFDIIEFQDSLHKDSCEKDIFAIVLDQVKDGLTCKIIIYDRYRIIELRTDSEKLLFIAPSTFIYIHGAKVKHELYVIEEYTGIIEIPQSSRSAVSLRKLLEQEMSCNIGLRRQMLKYCFIENYSLEKKSLCGWFKKCAILLKNWNKYIFWVNGTKIFSISYQ